LNRFQLLLEDLQITFLLVLQLLFAGLFRTFSLT
jgi:hypothetical protein